MTGTERDRAAGVDGTGDRSGERGGGQDSGGGGREVVRLDGTGRVTVDLVGGKGAQLDVLASLDDVQVPPACCVTTHVYRRAVDAVPGMVELLGQLDELDVADLRGIRRVSAGVREVVGQVVVPASVVAMIGEALAHLGDGDGDGAGWAVRSSAVGEDLPGSSFAGQHDSYLHVPGTEVPDHVRRCWASLFTERAVSYRLRHGLAHHDTAMAVVVQRMVAPDASGVLFTADPMTGNRTVAVVESCFGLGESVVSGHGASDVHRVRRGRIIERVVAIKSHAVEAAAGGGTTVVDVDPRRRTTPALADARVLELVELGRHIESHLGGPQDVEWCLAGGELLVVQSRPVTTLFPVPDIDDERLHVYVSVGHQQMMTDAMAPLGLSVWQLTTPRPMVEAGSRLFVDVTDALASPELRDGLLGALGSSDPLLRDALQTVLDRGELEVVAPSAAPGPPPAGVGAPPPLLDADPEIVQRLVRRTEQSVADAGRELASRSGVELVEFILEDLHELRSVLFDPEGLQVISTAAAAAAWLEQHLGEWLGEPGAVHVLTRSVPGNVTSEMGLALLDVADEVRPHAEVVAFLRQVADEGGERTEVDGPADAVADGPADGLLDRLAAVEGGVQAREALRGFLHRYGMRCAGEIDVTRPRWRERPAALVPLLLGHVDHAAPGEGARRFEQGRREAMAARHGLLERIRELPDGERMARDADGMIERLRTFAGYREHPKYGMVVRYHLYQQALWAEADRLVAAGVLRERADVCFLRLEELLEVLRTQRVDVELLARRREQYRAHRSLRPPRVLTSEGEALQGSYRRDDLPAGALPGLAVSAGSVEGRARVVLDLAEADLEPGDVLVTVHTDPSWSPLFVAAAALVTEVGGLMTHGAVVAREYGLPAVVGVQDATRTIRDGQRVRVDGARGVVELLE